MEVTAEKGPPGLRLARGQNELERVVLGSLVSSALSPPPQIPRGPASRAPRAGLLRLRASQPLN
ncbi:hypothetical protein PInf_024681 [Phytophthora infestans]|nr:hypothetical protein PInf_024681 [Phytophthora infestans]